ncbi:hypothetical protein D3C81_1438240 [compost metagenome]
MLRRMTGADDDLPVVVADADGGAVFQAPEAFRQGVDKFAEAAEAGPVDLDGVVIPAGAAVELDGVVRRGASGIGGQHAAHQVFHPGHPQLAAEFAPEPAGHANMVGVHVGDEEPCQAVGQRAAVAEQRAPGLRRFGRLQAGIHRGPACTIADGPQVDMVQAERHRHAQPEHAGDDLAGAAGLGRVAAGIVQFGFLEGSGDSGSIVGGGAHIGLGGGGACAGGRHAPVPAFWIPSP